MGEVYVSFWQKHLRTGVCWLSPTDTSTSQMVQHDLATKVPRELVDQMLDSQLMALYWEMEILEVGP